MNVLLLPKSAFCAKQAAATISDKAQLTHLKSVLSVQIGETLKIGQINGLLGTGVVARFDEDCLLTEVILNKQPPPKLDLMVILALPRPKVLRRLIMDMTAMGVGQIILINSCRTDKSYWSSPLLTKLDDFVLEGLQQGVDSVLPSVRLVKRFKPFVEDELPILTQNKKTLVAHPYATQSLSNYCADGLPQVVIVGAEGGFVPYEIALLQSMGVPAVTMGERILRTESAVNAILGRWLG